MFFPSRVVLPLAALAAVSACLAGCSGSTPGASASAPATSATVSTPVSSAAAGTTQAAAPSVSASPAATVSAAPPVVYLAEGGSVTGTALHAPGCQADCVLSGDSTFSLSDMTWQTWNSAVAAGTGTEKLDDCDPNCASGTVHSVAVDVALSKPVMVCLSGKGRWFWTTLTFRWPEGLPAAFSGDNAPQNPFSYSGISAQAATSCS
jgi:hypothetical protein